MSSNATSQFSSLDGRIAVIAAAFCVAIGVAFLTAMFWQFPKDDALRFIKHNLNFSFWAVILLPATVGLLIRAIRPCHLYAEDKRPAVSFVIAVIIVLVVVSFDLTKEGPPLSPHRLSYPTDAVRDAVLKVDRNLRASICRKGADSSTDCKSPKGAQDDYVKDVAKIAGVSKAALGRFESQADFWKRGSVVVYVEYMISNILGVVLAVMFLYLVHLVFTRAKPSPARRDALLIAHLLFVLWFPLRLYAIYYQRYYAFEDIGAALGIAVYIVVFQILMLLFLFRPGFLLSGLASLVAILGFVISVIARVAPELNYSLVEAFRDWLDQLDERIFALFVLIPSVVLWGVVGPYLVGERRRMTELDDAPS